MKTDQIPLLRNLPADTIDRNALAEWLIEGQEMPFNEGDEDKRHCQQVMYIYKFEYALRLV